MFSIFKKLHFLSNLISCDIAIDLGTANTLIWAKGEGILINEPSVVSYDIINKKVIAVGHEANAMVGKTPSSIKTVRPLKDGVIADFNMADGMMQGFIRKMNFSRIARPRMVICIPSGVTDVERRAVRDSAERANASEVYLIQEPIAAAIGIGIDISLPRGNMVVDIGGGTTEIAVISLNDIVELEPIRIAGDEQDISIINWFRNEHKLEIGYITAETIKITVGAAIRAKSQQIAVKGRDLVSGIPKTIEVPSDEIRLAIKDTISKITEAIKRALEKTPPELASDIIDYGIILTGGGSLLKGLDQHIRNQSNLPVLVAEEPLLSVVKGTGIVLENIKKYKEILL